MSFPTVAVPFAAIMAFVLVATGCSRETALDPGAPGRFRAELIDCGANSPSSTRLEFRVTDSRFAGSIRGVISQPQSVVVRAERAAGSEISWSSTSDDARSPHVVLTINTPIAELPTSVLLERLAVLYEEPILGSASTFEGFAHRTLASTTSGSQVNVAVATVRGNEAALGLRMSDPQDADIQVLGHDAISIETLDGKVLTPELVLPASGQLGRSLVRFGAKRDDFARRISLRLGGIATIILDPIRLELSSCE